MWKCVKDTEGSAQGIIFIYIYLNSTIWHRILFRTQVTLGGNCPDYVWAQSRLGLFDWVNNI